jgi:predicted ribosomally synthesized peptide with nif11-like leader
MSASEAERFANDLKANQGLLDELKKSAGGLGLSGVVAFAKQKGYSIDVDDAKSYIEAKAHKELTDEQLDRIAGGKGGGGGSATNISTNINVAVNVSAAVNAADVANVAGAVTAAVVAAVIVVT